MSTARKRTQCRPTQTAPDTTLAQIEKTSGDIGPSFGQYKIVNAFWTGNRVCLVQRTGDTVSRTFVPAEYTCFIRRDELDEVNETKLRELRYVASMRQEGSWWRLRWTDWNILKAACEHAGPKSDSRFKGAFERAGLKVYEADVNPVRRWLTDNNVIIQRPKRCFIDIEVDSRQTIAKQIEGKARVLSWAIVDDDNRKIYGLLESDTDEAEELLLSDLWDELLAYDQVCGWGSDRYDFPIIKARTELHGIEIETRRWLWLDHMEVYRRFNMSASESGEEKDSVALDRVAKAVLGRGKKDALGRSSYDTWANDPWRLVDYNIEDAILERDIETKTGYLELHFKVCEACNTLPDSRGTNPTNFVEGFMLKLGLEHDQHFPTKYEIEYSSKYEGAYVMEPTTKGLMSGVHVCDFAALYPSIIISWNMSPETLMSGEAFSKAELANDNCCYAPLTGNVFSTEREGLLPIALKKLLELRGYWKKKKASLPPGTPEWKDADRMSSAYKIAANSFYGVQGSIFSRFHVRDLAESITQVGKWLITKTHDAANDKEFNSVYGDTDSLFIVGKTNEEFQGFVDWCNSDLYPQLLEECGCKTNRIKLAYEKKFSRLVMISKKRYAGRYEHYEGTVATADSKPEIKGLEYKRGDTLRFAREMQYELIQLILFKEVEDVPSYLNWIKGWRDRILVNPLKIEDVRMSQKLGKDVRAYTRKLKIDGTPGALPVHVEVALEMAKKGLDIAEGVRIEYIVVDGNSPLKAVPATEFNGENVDRIYLWENLVYPPTQRVLEAAFAEHQWKDYLRIRPTKGGKARPDKLSQVIAA